MGIPCKQSLLTEQRLQWKAFNKIFQNRFSLSFSLGVQSGYIIMRGTFLESYKLRKIVSSYETRDVPRVVSISEEMIPQ